MPRTRKVNPRQFDVAILDDATFFAWLEPDTDEDVLEETYHEIATMWQANLLLKHDGWNGKKQES